MRLFRAQAPEIFGMVLGRCGNRVVAEDVLSQTFEAAAQHCSRGGLAEVTPGWLVTVAKRRLVDYWRRQRRATTLVERLTPRQQTSEAPIHVNPDLWAAVDSLAPNQRAVLVLRYVDDWSVAEIAEGLDMTYRAAESLLARARRSLRVALEKGGLDQ